jgi:hypothetical protein
MGQAIPAVIAEYEDIQFIEHPDGVYWQLKTGGKTYGPFSSLVEAVQDIQLQDEAIEPGESLEEAEDEIGIADWVDPETGLPAEESIARLDEH